MTDTQLSLNRGLRKWATLCNDWTVEQGDMYFRGRVVRESIQDLTLDYLVTLPDRSWTPFVPQTVSA